MITISFTKCDFVGLCTKNVMFYRGGSPDFQPLLRDGVLSHSVLCQMEEVGHVFSNHLIFKCSDPPLPPPLYFLTSP